jgi:hypothetical protein
MHKCPSYSELRRRKSGRLSVVDTRKLDSPVVSFHRCSSLTLDGFCMYVCILEPQGSSVRGGWFSDASWRYFHIHIEFVSRSTIVYTMHDS